MKKSYILLLACLIAAGCANNQSNNQPGSQPHEGVTVTIEPGDTPEQIAAKAAQVLPSSRQVAALDDEFIAFVHFGPNTFTRREWGTGKEDPKIFDLKTLDTDQWCKAMKDAGMTKVILTVKHHDGFVLYQTRYTKHGIMSTGFENGQGDILRSLSESCAKFGLKLGVYLSPADLRQMEDDGLYGNGSEVTLRTIPKQVEDRPFADKRTFQYEVDDYNEYFMSQLFELLTEYGPISEMWFDGAHPKHKGGQQYNYADWTEMIRTLAPDVVMFNVEDIRWFLNAVDNPHNGLTFCAGSLSAGAYNDVVAMAREFAPRTHFVHLRSCNVLEGGNFIEAPHTGGRAHLVELCRIFTAEERRRGLEFGLPMRVDHGKDILDDAKGGYNPGYGFYGRMWALGQVTGMMAAVEDEMKEA